MSFPEKYKYTKDHEWIVVDNGKTCTVGITSFAQSELGELVFVELPAIGKSISKGDTLCVVESTKAASDVYAPVSGKVVAVNDKLSSEPALVNSDPHAQGWLVKLEIADLKDMDSLMDATEYSKRIG